MYALRYIGYEFPSLHYTVLTLSTTQSAETDETID